MKLLTCNININTSCQSFTWLETRNTPRWDMLAGQKKSWHLHGFKGEKQHSPLHSLWTSQSRNSN